MTIPADAPRLRDDRGRYAPEPGRNNARRDYRTIFVEHYGPGPWQCAYEKCDDLVYEIGRAGRAGNVHHKDEDFTNNDPENLEIMHHGCHRKEHLTGVPKTAEHNRKVGDANRGKVRSPEQRKKLSEAHRGISLSQAHRDAIAAAHRGKRRKKITCEKCGYTAMPGWVRRHTCP